MFLYQSVALRLDTQLANVQLLPSPTSLFTPQVWECNLGDDRWRGNVVGPSLTHADRSSYSISQSTVTHNNPALWRQLCILICKATFQPQILNIQQSASRKISHSWYNLSHFPNTQIRQTITRFIKTAVTNVFKMTCVKTLPEHHVLKMKHPSY